MAPAALEIRRYQIRGLVQGVGFRPFVYRVAERHALGGWVRNAPGGTVLEVQGRPQALEQFIAEVRACAPALARIESVALLHRGRADGPARGFSIHASLLGPAEAGTAVAPDTAVCETCLRELFDPSDRRYRYPYVNCTDCGPRYSIVSGVPYDRARTTMEGFPLCERCAREYHDVRDRRFHAQGIACWECGPRMMLVRPEVRPLPAPRPSTGAVRHATDSGGTPAGAVAVAAQLLGEGAIVAVKGLGGYHLMVDARDARAVARLRRRKRCEERPLAVMSPTVDAVRGYAHVGKREAQLLSGARRPIVLVRKDPEALAPLAAGVAPGNRRHGVMLAYAPVHHLLLAGGFDALVATSGNVAEDPIAFEDEEALERLARVADAFLVGERAISTRVEDSIVRVVSFARPPAAMAAGHGHPARPGVERALRPRAVNVVQTVRRARGYAPEAVRAPFALPPLLAVGAELKSTVCLTRGRELFLSDHLGDLGNEATVRAFEHAIGHLTALLEVAPRAIAHDLHPGYRSTRFALAQESLPTVAVQHHHAHMAACMCEHGLREPVVGVVFDGSGYGPDGNEWGGEFLVGDYVGFERAAHLRYFRLLGGELAVREPYRVALALLHDAFGEEWPELDLPVVRARGAEERRVLARMLRTGLRAPECSSVGRLFDGVAALLGVRERSSYEAQAAIELEQLADPRAAEAEDGRAAPAWRPTPNGGGAPLAWELGGPESWPWWIDLRPAVRELVREMRRGVPAARLSGRFHRTVVDVVRGTCDAIGARTGIERVVLSGDVFQNEVLLRGCHRGLTGAGWRVYAHARVPTNDGGIALGQAAVAGWGGP